MVGSITRFFSHAWIRFFSAGVIFTVFLTVMFFRQGSGKAVKTKGGKVFPSKVILEVPLYLQTDSRWGDLEIGSGEKIASVGCALCSVAMVLSALDDDVLPNSLNGYLNENEGYNYRGWLRWSKCLEPTNGRVVVSYLGDPDHKKLDDYLSREIPSIVKVFIGGVIPHWVVVVGKQGEEYIINDPLNSQGSQRYLSYYGEKVYSMRVFEKALSK